MNCEFRNTAQRTGETGAALVTAIFVLLLITLLGVLIYRISVISYAISLNERNNTEAFYAADAGISHAMELIAKVPGSKYSLILQAGANPLPGTGDELSVPTLPGLWPAADSIYAGDNTSGGVTGFGAGGQGRYWVSVRNDTAPGETPNLDRNGILIVTSTGIGRGESNSTIEAIVFNETVTYPGFVADGNVKMNGPLKVLGPNGIVYVNGTTDNLNSASGLVCGEQRVYSVGAITHPNNTWTSATCTTSTVPGTTLFQGAPKHTPPIFDVTRLRNDFRPLADFVFKQGVIYRQVNGVQDAAPLTAAERAVYGFDLWNWNGANKRWSLTNNNAIMYDAIYYFEDSSALIKTTYQDNFNPPKVTIFAEGYIDIPSGPTLQPKLPYYALVSANDLSLGLKVDMNINPGLVYAYGQIEIAGKTEITGSVVASNFRLPDGTNGPDVNDPGGNNLVKRSTKDTVNFTNELIIRTVADGIDGGLHIENVGWREVRY